MDTGAYFAGRFWQKTIPKGLTKNHGRCVWWRFANDIGCDWIYADLATDVSVASAGMGAVLAILSVVGDWPNL